MVDEPGSFGFSKEQWLSGAGFTYAGGSAGGFLCDMFVEFGWLGVFPLFLLGFSYSYAWKKWKEGNDLWKIINFMKSNELQSIQNISKKIKKSYEYTYSLILILDINNLISHGSSIRFPWLSNFAKEVISLYNNKKWEDDNEI